MILEQVARLAGLDQRLKAALNNECLAAYDLSLLPDQEIALITQSRCKRRRLAAIKKYISGGNSLGDNTTMELVTQCGASLQQQQQKEAIYPGDVKYCANNSYIRNSKNRPLEGKSYVHHKLFRYVQADLLSALPSAFDIGAKNDFDQPIPPKTFLNRTMDFVIEDPTTSDRRSIGSVIAMPGWGKTYALTHFAKFITQIREDAKKCSPSFENSDSNKFDSTRCVPLLITLNSKMTLPFADASGHDYDKEIAMRMAYAYFADIENIEFSDWVKSQDSSWTRASVLKEVNAEAKRVLQKDPILILVVDEPDHREGAGKVVQALAGNALRHSLLDCRVVLSSLEQRWLFMERTNSGRDIHDLKLQPPTSEDFRDLLIIELQAKLQATLPEGTKINEEVLECAVEYIVTLASGHWRTIAEASQSIVRQPQFDHTQLKAVAGLAKAHVPLAWKNFPDVVGGQLEEVLAHSILGSTLLWMEPLHEGPAWQCIIYGVVQIWLGLSQKASFDPIVPLLALRDLSRKTSDSNILQENWAWQSKSQKSSYLLLQTLKICRFFPSSDVSSQETESQLYEDFTACFVLLKWDARERVDSAVRRRWKMIIVDENDTKEMLLRIPGGLKKYNEDKSHPTKAVDPNYNYTRMEQSRDGANKAWIKSHGKDPNKAHLPGQDERPYLCLVPALNAHKGEFDKRLHIFRDAVNCTKNTKAEGIWVLSPNVEEAKIKVCGNKLFTKRASIENNGKLAAGSVVKPAKNNDSFDLLIVLQKSDKKWTFALIENKLEANSIGITDVKKKLNGLEKYRGRLWKEHSGNSKPKNTDGFKLPDDVVESDVVWVMLHDNGYSALYENGSEDLKKDWADLGNSSGFSGHILLTTSENFFGRCFQKVNLLQCKNSSPKRYSTK